ncbi:LLM class oxidoreductase [Leptospira semungkisensis]|uniref:LLM class oxidoreductase n=1 Tax=Leptospira semungkisensis TaxID=2484985 RepID=A0A4V3JC48_9LEPT|nr:LLM class oxidoreductase [Leptospira semungkisensis]TGK04739.1 LLM class oxidoreductase [Leptospira semungkisensis]
MFQKGKLTVGVFFPIEAFEGARPTMSKQIELAQRAEQGGFSALWFRDVPLLDPTFGDIGQVFDPFVYLGYIAAQTESIALATGSIILPIRHPIHTAKAAASVDQLSQGRLVLGIASGDRPVEYPLLGLNFEKRGEIFRNHLGDFRKYLENEFPEIQTEYGTIASVDLVPKPFAKGIPTLVTGFSQQSLKWIAENADGWISYPRSLDQQLKIVSSWRDTVEEVWGDRFLPFAQSLYIDLQSQPDAPPKNIHLGFSSGRKFLTEVLIILKDIGVNHVVLNLKYGRRPASEVLEELIQFVLPELGL